jgi:CubicO group peptidase (beta-lactamase class C family)
MKKPILINIFLISSVIGYAQQSKQPPQWDRQAKKSIDSLVLAEITQNKVPGAVVQVSIGGRVVLSQAYGYALRFDSSGKPVTTPEKMTKEHLFDIASLTKVAGTTTAIMKLVSEKRLQVDDSISKFLPAFRTAEKSGITVQHLLTHTSGLYEWYPMYYVSHKNRKTTYDLIASLPLNYAINQQRKYSDLGFTVLGQLIETLSGKPLEVYLEDSIFRPLGMLHTFYLPNKKSYKGPVAPTSFGNPYEYRMAHDSALGFRVKEIDPSSWNGWRHYLLRGEANDGNAWYANGGVSGAAGLFSTMDDLQTLTYLLLNKGMKKGKYFIRPEVVETFLRVDKFKNGLGWMMDPHSTFMKNAPVGSFGHTGFTGTSIVAIPEFNSSLIILINRQQSGLPASGEYNNVNPLRGALLEVVLKYLQH